jgi:hypothetical protein
MGGHCGLPTFFLFLSQSSWENRGAEWAAFLASVLFGWGYLQWLKSRIQDEREIFSIALAFGAAIHPLAFSYSFAWSFPMAAFVVDRFRLKERSSVGDWSLFVSGMGLLHVYGSGMVGNLGLNLPAFGERAIGCFLLALLLVRKKGASRGA